MPIVLFLALLSVLLLALMTLSPAPAGAVNVKRLTASAKACPNQNNINASARTQTRAMHCLINHARKKRGLRKLKKSRQLNRSARRKSGDMKRCGSFDHYACGRDFSFWMRKVGYTSRCWTAAENIAWGQGRLGSPRKIFVAWLRSPGHRANMFSGRFSALGAGLRKGTFQGHRRARVWTTHFGHRC